MDYSHEIGFSKEFLDDMHNMYIYTDEEALKNFVDQAFKIINAAQHVVKAREWEITSLKNLNDVDKNTIDNIKHTITQNMKAAKVKKLIGETHKLTLRKSHSVDIHDESLIPDLYMTEKTVRKADKMKLKESLNLGLDIDGCRLVENQNLQLK